MKRLITLLTLVPLLFALVGCNLPTAPDAMPVVEKILSR